MVYAAVFSGGQCAADTNAIVKKIGLPSFIIAADSGFESALSFAAQHGRKSAIKTGDMDSISKMRLNEYMAEAPLCRCEKWERDKDFSDTELALIRAREWALEAAGARVVLFGGGGGERIEHFLALTKIVHKDFAPHLWFFAEQCVSVLQTGTTLTLSQCRQNDYISIFCGSAENNSCANIIHAEGLFWNIDTLDWENGAFSLSNKISAEYENLKKDVRITVEQGVFFLFFSLRTFLHAKI